MDFLYLLLYNLNLHIILVWIFVFRLLNRSLYLHMIFILLYDFSMVFCVSEVLFKNT